MEAYVKGNKLTEEELKKVKRFYSIFCEKSDWKVHSGKWKRLQASVAFTHLSELSPSILEVYGNKEPDILKSLSFPSMPLLQELNIKNNKIKNLNGLSRFQMPNLKILMLGDNYIVSLKELRKLHAPRLEELSLYANRVNSLEYVSASLFPKIQVLILGLNCLSDFRPLNKCNWTDFSRISLENNLRCGQCSAYIIRPMGLQIFG